MRNEDRELSGKQHSSGKEHSSDKSSGPLWDAQGLLQRSGLACGGTGALRPRSTPQTSPCTPAQQRCVGWWATGAALGPQTLCTCTWGII